jgi:hypothetical protein
VHFRKNKDEGIHKAALRTMMRWTQAGRSVGMFLGICRLNSRIRQAGEFAADNAFAMISLSADMFTPNTGALMNIFMSLTLTVAFEYGQMVHMKMK